VLYGAACGYAPQQAATDGSWKPGGYRASEVKESALLGLLVLVGALLHGPVAAAQQSDADLAAAAQNPVAATYSLPFQNNIFGGAGPTHNAVGNALNI
jgi:hypothetical protein